MGRCHDQWHDELDQITASLDQLALDTDEDVRAVVLNRLRRPTDVFLRRKKWFFRSTTQEDRLNALIRGHADKAVAILSCAHILSRMTIRSLLATPIELNVDLTIDASVSRYVGLIATISYINNKAVSEEEAARARSLILLLEKKSETFLGHLCTFFSGENTELLYDIFPPGTLDALLQRLFQWFAGRIDVMREQCRWADAYRAIGKLSTALGISPMLDSLINSTLADVRAWSRWRPAKRRIFGQEHLAQIQKEQLQDVLMLNGPDFGYARHHTSLDALIYQARQQSMNHIRNGSFFAWLSTDPGMDSRKYLDGILNFPSGPRTFMPGAVDLFAFLCLHPDHDVTINTLRIFEAAASLTDPRVYRSLSDVFRAPTPLVRTAGLMYLLRAIRTSGNHELVVCLDGFIRQIVDDDFSNMQKTLHDLYFVQARRNPQPIATQLQALGQCIVNIPELRYTLSQACQVLFRDWPSETEVDALFQLRSEVVIGNIGLSIETLLDEFCIFRLTGRGTLNVEWRNALAALLWHWQAAPHIPRRSLALSIISCTTPQLSLALRSECLTQIRNLDEDHLRDLDAIISSSSELACVALAKLLCSRRFLRLENRTCWHDVLRTLLLHSGETILELTASKLDVKGWFEWLDYLRKIFKVLDGGPNAAFQHELLRPELHMWSQTLERTYLSVLTRLEIMPGMSLLVQGALCGWRYQRHIETIFSYLDNAKDFAAESNLASVVIGVGCSSARDVDNHFWETIAVLVY
jgi:hypothetical protein